MNETIRNGLAAFRFGLIAPIVQRQLQPRERYALLKEIAKQRYTIPGSEKNTVSVRSLERYLQAYERDGFEGLKPQLREKRGSLRNQDPWYDDGFSIAQEMLSQFSASDWVELSRQVLTKPLEWQKKLIYCLDNEIIFCSKG